MATTEDISPRYRESDTWDAGALTDSILEGQMAAVAAVAAARDALTRAIDLTTQSLRNGGRLVFVGAGTSGRIAAQEAAELLPTFNWPADRSLFVMAGGNDALHSSVEGAEDDGAAATAAIQDLALKPDDVLIGVAASGNTPFTIAALEAARAAGAGTIGVFNSTPCRMEAVCDVPVGLVTGPEFVAGSTRMKAGTAQKAALNTLTTAVMVQLGFVYRGEMIEMPPTNIKLKARSARIVARVTGHPVESAQAALEKTNGHIKTAIVMLAENADAVSAAAQLATHDGNLRNALEKHD